MASKRTKSSALLDEVESLRRRVAELERAAGDPPARERRADESAEELLRRRERQLAEVQQIAHLGSWEWDIGTDTVTWSEELYRIFSLRPEEFRATYEGYLERVHPEDRQRARRIVDGSFRSGRPFVYDTRILRPDGEVRWILARGEVIRDATGRSVRMVGTALDITEKRRADEEVLRARKLESIGVLAGGMAHDFNNLLTVILGNVLLMKARLGPDDPDLGKLTDAEEACLRARRLTQRLLTFAEGGAPVKRAVFLSTLVEDACRIAAGDADLRMDLSLPPDLWAIDADEAQIGQVLNCLTVNAAQAMPSGGTVRIAAENVVVDESAISPASLPPGRYVRLTVRDEGVGIPPEDLPRIFDPYFTTRGPGSGLGLAAAHSIIHRHGGGIRAESKPGRGATFILELPASETPGAAGPGVEAAPAAPAGGRILVMDDEALVRVMLGDMLRHFGYEVVLTASGAEAVEAYERGFREGRPFAAVILDLTVPGGMGGKETMRRLLEIDPGARAIVASGYSNDPVMSQYRRHGFRGVVAKPFRLEEMKRALHGVLRGDDKPPRRPA
jgi:PAS domain S-box-containing protein